MCFIKTRGHIVREADPLMLDDAYCQFETLRWLAM